MRVPEAGTLQYLRTSFNQEAIEQYFDLTEAAEAAKGKEKTRLKKQLAERFSEGQPKAIRPRLTRWQGYATPGEAEPSAVIYPGPFDPDLIVLTRSEDDKSDSEQKDARKMGLEATLQLTSALRDAAMKAAGDNVPEWLSGHQRDGRPTTKPHAAFFPLPFVGAKHADGHILGLAIAIPRTREIDNESRHDAIRRAIGPLLFDDAGHERTIRLWRGNVWNWRLHREKREYPPLALRAATWTGPGTEWASVTPVVLHHYPKRNRENDVERIVLEAFASAGLPEPSELRAQPVSLFTGAGHARSMPQFTEGGASLCRYQVHVVVKFPCPVQGPVLIGRGRFRGYGLLRPLGVNRDGIAG
jgi:CRISPR-associated protein Csb2